MKNLCDKRIRSEVQTTGSNRACARRNGVFGGVDRGTSSRAAVAVVIAVATAAVDVALAIATSAAHDVGEEHAV